MSLARREQAERARPRSPKSRGVKKSKENELAAAKAQVEELRCLLGQSAETTPNCNAKSAKHRKRSVGRSNSTNKHTKEKQHGLRCRQIGIRLLPDQQENMIVTFKNKEGKVLEESLEELSNDKLQELGFDVEVLKKDSNGGEE
ncbi:MAG: hypothetical protein R2792_06790 [Saprospiraceae bacterium]